MALIVKRQSGQAALVILAIMAIGMTMALSLSKRVVTDIKMSEQEQKSAKAFSAAEAGIEEALRKLRAGEEGSPQIAPGEFGVSDLDVNVQTSGGADQFAYPVTLQSGQTAIVWFCDHNEDTGEFTEDNCYAQPSINFCWQDGAAVEIVYFYNNGGAYQIKRFAYDPNAVRRTNDNHFSAPDLGPCVSLNVGATLDLTVGVPLFLAVRPFYQNSQFAVETIGGATLPVQGHTVTSSGAVVSGEEEKITRKVKVFRTWPIPPDSFFQSIFSANSVSGG